MRRSADLYLQRLRSNLDTATGHLSLVYSVSPGEFSDSALKYATTASS
jgi:hypothetical protein